MDSTDACANLRNQPLTRHWWLGALLLWAACTGSSNPGTPDGGVALDFSAFDQAIEGFVTAQGLPGATAVVVHRDLGVVHLKGYGSFDPGRLFLIASSSKILSVGVLMRLADQKLLDLDGPIGTVVTGRWGEGKGTLTVAQMLSNSSGLVGLLDEATYPPYLCQYVPQGTLTGCAQMIYKAADSDRIVPPDTRFRYGGGQWQLAGGVAEAASGKSWEQLIRETYVEPCGTTSLGYTNQFARGGMNYPAFFMANPANLDRTENPSIEGGAYITTADYAKILLMHLRQGLCGDKRVLGEAAVARMQMDRIGPAYGGVTPDPTLQGYGLGWWVDRVNPGVVADAGAYGAMPWLDGRRGYGAFIVIEATATQGAQLRLQTKPILDGIFDAGTLSPPH
jgi:CubicO group peptidase (beta-lactamase class C family)